MTFRTRANDWSICLGPSVQVAAIAGGAINLYKFRNNVTNDIFLFGHLILGVGAGLSFSILKAAGEAAKAMMEDAESLFEGAVDAVETASAGFEDLDVQNAFSANDLDWSSCMFEQLGGGVAVAGYKGTAMRSYGTVWSGIHKVARDFFQYSVKEKSDQFGATIIIGGGPLFSIMTL
ncbi:hypothetical protein [Dyella tabacisoli]|uniref:Uncharacterized protein n=1 Tax=Dyella tabacisoli TaxID=2282381 RepID=A0A369UI00_9GAMM|nr:hypothetical protein [Dyella tabacisoli]RDD80176.1 hypothetical protein DVJ77_18720 [Dyella tabacisoli]